MLRKLKFRNRLIIYQKCPFKEQLSLASYAQSSVPGELRTVYGFYAHLSALTWFGATLGSGLLSNISRDAANSPLPTSAYEFGVYF